MLQQIQKIACQAQEAGTPTAFFFATVESLTPLTLWEADRFSLTGEVLSVLREVEGEVVALDGTTSHPLALGERVVVLRNQGGSGYLLLGRAAP